MNIIALIHSNLDDLSPAPLYKLKPGEIFWAMNGIQQKKCFRVLSDKQYSLLNTDHKFELKPKDEKMIVYRKEFWQNGESY